MNKLMKFYFIFIVIFFLNNCSFDTKSGIWKSDKVLVKKNDEIFKEFKKIQIEEDVFNEEIFFDNKSNLKISKPINNLKWQDIYFSEENNLKNFNYNNYNQIIFKSKKIIRSKLNNNPLFHNDNLVISDDKGNIIVFSLKKKKIISKFNFYKKNFKDIKKKLNLYLENNIIYVSDNLGYLYSFDYDSNKINWAVNYKLPFKSNLKITNEKIITADVNNNLVIFSKKNGGIIELIPTESTTITNEFINNISKNKENIFFLNSYGSLYSINSETMRFNWFINLNSSLSLNQSSLFNGSQIINTDEKIVVSSNKSTYLIDSKTGTILKKYNFSSLVKPIINNNICFFITKNNFLVAVNLENFKILFSQDINLRVSQFLNSKKKELSFKEMMLLNDEIYIFLNNSYILNFENNGMIKKINKLPSKINSSPIVINSSIIFLNKNNKFIIVN
jgi:hypothetical protein